MCESIVVPVVAVVIVGIAILHIHDLRRDIQRLEAERDRYRDMWDRAIERAQRAEAVVARCKNAIADSYELKDSDEPRPPDPDHSPR